ncbi:MAG: acetyl/propionyl/methylcrotonyl-CoA carboxylase subunit alpha [Achromobacter sp.]|jgi:3-methylcrotonyl-CoA carboxylase alpha subunit|uniref:Acetyl-/propionyl-coenzyme A carboxylase alpha chain n=1 Tax=Achromobacter insuavis TaxID=1287735 RepID=A0A6J5A8Z8_9BURK|nr:MULTISPECIES: acetyl/propionyl/methylcrotonyl-CoA carboxylase subunit alpha [Achromobacter]MBN9639627.1 acetyl/propionyl/methylcrotonyl-CoA carboxylase subunit alpha [Achromobacter sp.]CAB3658854.1 Acetyl-/propionyl-coenzyme A carboxylase alpha chain [Achromobacter insuavis]CUJ72573.1 Acetyl-/propionyl-coenzyme A carboxylase alpha chain [Achromobacter sp. 2789STDY5608633]CUJ79824.1 Acetyl-/propionyl-coenzyme A carboxylase alpha chain [Achromobacter sp. 2789STDY5608628]
MFDTLLIANRGEIACRVAATARRLGIRTVAVYSDADANARHVAACDVAVHIGGPEPRASYLRADAILQAARDTGAGAIHPGYGFLSENEAFAEAAEQAGIAFVGPPASAIAAMGSKSAAKSLMEKAGVPLVPGYHGDNQDPQFLKEQADAIGYPVLIKASAGGGGKGMRVVESTGAFLDALASCQREAASSFGDDRVLIERYLQKPRHIEIQVFADTHGNCVYLFERDCSVQRRHQKVIEEAPAPGMTEERRRAMGEAAVAAARAVGYVGAGTVEFIAEPDGRFYFMEMNTRLQVEHPVTEMITGHDLVEWQLRVAAGQPLPARQEDLRIHGHAIEARIYAENPEKGFLPSIGTLAYLGLPAHVAFANGDIRVDGGVRTGDTITPFYDPMIAKLIVHGADRDQARARMLQALAQTQAVGVQTNVAFLSRLMRDSAFAAADLDTGLIEHQRATLLPEPTPADAATLALATAAVLASQGQAQSAPHAAAPADPWDTRDGWRLGGRYQRQLQWIDNGETRHVGVARQGADWTLDSGDGARPFAWRAEQATGPARVLRITLDGRERAGTVVLHADKAHVFGDGGARVLDLYDPLAHAQDTQGDHGGGLTAPMPGKIISIAVKAGDSVAKGQPLLVMEAMKMEHTISAPADGKVEELFYAVGDQVTEGAELVSIGD